MGPMAGKQTLFIWGFLTTSTPTPSSSQSSEVNTQSQPDSTVSLFFSLNKLDSKGPRSFSRENPDTQRSNQGSRLSVRCHLPGEEGAQQGTGETSRVPGLQLQQPCLMELRGVLGDYGRS